MQIYENAYYTFASLALVSKAFHECTRRYRGRSQIFYFERSNTKRKQIRRKVPQGPNHYQLTRKNIKTLLEAPAEKSLLSNIRHITIGSDSKLETELKNGYHCQPQKWTKDPAKWIELIELITKISKLDSLTFRAFEPIPLGLIEALEKHHPRAELHVENWTRLSHDQDHTEPSEIALATSRNLVFIHADIWVPEAKFDFRIPALMRIVELAPNLKHVEIYSRSTVHMKYRMTPTDLLELQQGGALFRTPHQHKRQLRSLKSFGRDWINTLCTIVDFQSLDRLEIDQEEAPAVVVFFDNSNINHKADTCFPSLKHLSVTFYKPNFVFNSRYERRARALEAFILSCRPLESFEIVGAAGCEFLVDVPGIMKHHGPSLKHLSIFERDIQFINGPEHDLIISELKDMLKFCPHLQEIGIDLYTSRNGSRERDVFNVVTQFSECRVLRLKSTSPLDVRDPPNETYDMRYGHNPFRRDFWIANMWSFIRAGRRQKGFQPIEEMHLITGSGTKTLPSKMRSQLTLVARQSARDDRPDEIVVEWPEYGSRGEKVRRIWKFVPPAAGGF